MIDQKLVPGNQQGLFVPATNVFYTVLITEFTKASQIIQILRRVLTKRDILDFHKQDLSGHTDKAAMIRDYLPVIMTADYARKNDIPFEIYHGSEMDKKRYEQNTNQPKENKRSIFKKENK